MDTLVEQVDGVARGDVSPTELVESALKAVEWVEDLTNAFTTVLPDDAMERARDLERAGSRGPLHGVPVAVKDLYDVTGVVTTGCCAAYRDRMATEDSAVVAKLRAAGAIIVAKTNMHELAFGATSQVSCYGPVRNPWDLERIPAGSSGGSGAAVAAGAVAMAMGSDTGGSIRLPSSMCGVTGLKPTHGAVSLRGALPMTASFDTGGPLARSAEDCRVVFDVISGFDAGYIYSTTGTQLPVRPPSDTRIALVAGWLADAHTDVANAVVGVAEELGRLGYTVVEVAGFDPLGMRDDVSPLLVGEFAHHFRDLWDDPRVSEPIAMLMRLGRETSGIDYVKGRERAQQVRMDFMREFAGVDALLAPGAPYPAPRADEVDNLLEAVRSTVFTLPVNAAGLPSLAFPTGFSDGLPVGAQLIGPPWSENALCAIGAAYQRVTDHHLHVAQERSAKA